MAKNINVETLLNGKTLQFLSPGYDVGQYLFCDGFFYLVVLIRTTCGAVLKQVVQSLAFFHHRFLVLCHQAAQRSDVHIGWHLAVFAAGELTIGN